MGWFRALATVAVVVLLMATSWLWVQLDHQRRASSLRQGALKAAATYGVYLSTYDYRNLTGPDAAWTFVEQHSTPTFAKNFHVETAALAPRVTEAQSSAQGTVRSAAVASLSGQRAIALLFVDQTLRASAHPGAEAVQKLRVEVALVHRGGRWWIDSFQLVS